MPDRRGRLDSLQTPVLLLDRGRLRSNLERMAGRMRDLGGTLRPHVKTSKSIEVLKEIVTAGHTRGITVSTLGEAEFFFGHGIRDITYAVGIAPNKLQRIAELLDRGCDLKIVLDTTDMAKAVAAAGEQRGVTYRVLIELDTDGHRSGVDPGSDELIAIGRLLHDSAGTELLGVLTHAGESYACRTPETLLAMARRERDRSVAAAGRLRAAGLPCPTVSIGSTPTALSVDHLEGITEVRAGVYVFFDLVQAGIGVCTIDDIALSVLASVIGHQKEKGWIIADAGWMALSRDRGTADHEVDQGYGAAVDSAGTPIDELIVSAASQEHGIITPRSGAGSLPYERLGVGSQLRIMPNHACATAAQFDRYYVIEDGNVVAEWPRFNGR